jgi:chromatin remodeling complex protein RSC6
MADKYVYLQTMSENILVDTPVTAPQYPASIAKLMEKLNTKMDALKTKIATNKREADELVSEFKQLEKAQEQVVAKIIKKTLTKKPRKPSGFALPVKVSPELCAFMGLEQDALIARTSVTTFIMKYIDEKGLKNPEKKSIILPDAALATLLGPEAKDAVITHFTIQKYINRHFQKANP